MSVTLPQIIELIEYVPNSLGRTLLPDAVGEMLWRNYNTQVSVEFPSPKTDNHWRLTSQGWVGHIPLTPDFHLALRPKVKLSNLFRMLEYTYDLKGFRFLEGLVDCQTLLEFYERLADILARRILKRSRQGFYCAYVSKTERLPHVRGRINVRQLVTRPWDTKIQCQYEQHTADLEDNQIIAWTLWQIVHSGLCTERVMPTLRTAYHSLQRLVTLQPCNPRSCIGRRYNRLNQDYHPLHALCRFFLEHIAPSHETGTNAMLPFLVNLSQLYERFVAEWLKAHRETLLLPFSLDIQSQERIYLGQQQELYLDIDLVIYDLRTGIARYVLDTKYKTASRALTSDINQMVAYAEAKGCHQAILIYPSPLAEPLNIKVGSIQIRSLTFSLEGDLEQAGYHFLQDVLKTDSVVGYRDPRTL
ncbi:McrC family protein [Aetokthonos hydrillicola Thurmond2011]|jgi:5-methylcytosine-specific restriction enzyme subunit McrC|uniref:McrC family protein n=2 Tax=Aetokthonos TaxID=1550243 RepID=A0AAP5I5L9_9CYAN|nr:restriction endonuclease [Aetokthonos hydrillicola]MBO3459464.1 restriction endonuclease [Aetokthonos hydrillicola CCALA 1050]MBW4583826.1 McrC family protein [Aetokthonos hydrillicola CCALA 1050]MDR9895478.1 McrC family protein [Aetokthonos hydrillicola Thurmond2011]